MINKNAFLACIAGLLSLALAGCGGGLDVTIGGSLTGLLTGATVVLQNNGSDPLTLTTNGSFTFQKALDSNVAYSVTVQTQPNGQTCTVANGSGTIASPAVTITNVSVTCSTSTLLVGTVTGLQPGAAVTLVNNGVASSALPIGANGTFSFPGVTSGAYKVTVSVQPALGSCTVTAGTGTIVANTQTAVVVTCS